MKRWLVRSLSILGLSGCWSDPETLDIPEPLQRDIASENARLNDEVASSNDEVTSKPRRGKWRRVRDSEILTEEQKAEIEQLEALGYVSGSVERQSTSVIPLFEPNLVQPGLNLYVSGHGAEATLMTMDGEVLHTWKADFHEIWPDHKAKRGASGTHHFRRAKVLENGDLIAIYEGRGVLRLDKDSRVLWAKDNKAHHDVDFRPNGDLVVLTRAAHLLPALNKKNPILEDFLVVLGPDGAEKHRVSLLRALQNSSFREIWRPGRAPHGDVFHTNTVHLLGAGLEKYNPAFKEGRVLTSSRHLDAIFVVDLELEEVVWAYRGEFRRQHDPRIVSDGGLMLFDNVGDREGSRVLEYDLSTMEIRWSFAASPADQFSSKTLGTAHRLANGNTLVTESEGGRAFELTPDGTLVWEFLNPNRAGEHGEFIAALFEVTRLPENFGADWIERAE